MEICIIVGGLSLDAELNDTATARKVAEILPFAGPFDTWGDEIYFTIPVVSQLDESAKEEVEVGDIGYWPTGRAFCIFFGPTPVSPRGKIIPASAVNIIGRIIKDAPRLKEVIDREKVEIRARPAS
ncbi:conserved hypothetical protein [uncultured Desulfobacterium sp.]|uniref:Cyclophilin TM1367-like domain-containing protein n=1 Tax=uncultured Desulfobacterium sp. TaxID=201089 RepID=A0A445N1T1_9BACT|nr:conserved hypothetical protein [uncultured Desulfobacterium sp.]